MAGEIVMALISAQIRSELLILNFKTIRNHNYELKNNFKRINNLNWIHFWIIGLGSRKSKLDNF